MKAISRWILALLLLAASPQAVASADSTSAPHPAIGWQSPSARGLSGVSACPSGSIRDWTGSAWACVNSLDVATNAANATTAQYADNAGQLGGNGLPTCPTGYVLTGNGISWQCVNSVANSDYATDAGTGVANVSGTTLSLTNGTTYTLPSGGSGGSGHRTVVLRVGNAWTVPNGVTTLTVELYGGGGGGSGYISGGGGGYCEFTTTVTSGATYSYSVGGGGSWNIGSSETGGNTSWQGGYYVTGGAGGPSGAGGSYSCAGATILQGGNSGISDDYGSFDAPGGAGGGPQGASYGVGGTGSGWVYSISSGSPGAVIVTY